MRCLAPDFLRLSRTSIDDSIAQNLNSLVTPGNRPFDPRITSSRQHPATPPARRQIDPAACDGFKERVLFPSWQMRSDVLSYCTGVATSPDPSDPESLLREVENSVARERIVDERLDPYSGRYFPREPRTESLASLIRNERMVEGIIRSRTWSLVGERCGTTGQSFEEAMDGWRRKGIPRKGAEELN
jgi:Caffeine-induced death protein 2